MSFFNDALKVISAPVTVPAKVFSNVVKTVDNSSPIGKTLSNTFAAPYEITKNGVSGESIARAKEMAGPALSVLSTAAAPGLTASLGFDVSKISGLTDVFGNTTGAKVNPVPGGQTYEAPAAATPLPSSDGTSFDIVPIFVIAGAGVLALLLFKGKK